MSRGNIGWPGIGISPNEQMHMIGLNSETEDLPFVFIGNLMNNLL